jgi:hypothetical protein
MIESIVTMKRSVNGKIMLRKPILPAEIELFLLYKTPNFLVQGVSFYRFKN